MFGKKRMKSNDEVSSVIADMRRFRENFIDEFRAHMEALQSAAQLSLKSIASTKHVFDEQQKIIEGMGSRIDALEMAADLASIRATNLETKISRLESAVANLQGATLANSLPVPNDR